MLGHVQISVLARQKRRRATSSRCKQPGAAVPGPGHHLPPQPRRRPPPSTPSPWLTSCATRSASGRASTSSTSKASSSQYKGRATCSTRDTLNPIYATHQQKQRRAEIEKVLDDLMIFIRHIRGRIESYVSFEHETLAYLGRAKTGPSGTGRPAWASSENWPASSTPSSPRARTRSRRRTTLPRWSRNSTDRPRLRRRRRAGQMQAVHRGLGGHRRQPGRTGRRMPLGRENAPPEGRPAHGHRPAPGRDCQAKSAAPAKSCCATPPTTKEPGTDI